MILEENSNEHQTFAFEHEEGCRSGGHDTFPLGNYGWEAWEFKRHRDSRVSHLDGGASHS
jgi:hypothetical protein